jgi:predicted nucleic acid-binding protein
MVLRYLLDTNTCIYIRRKQPKVVARFEKLTPGEDRELGKIEAPNKTTGFETA